MLIQRVLSIRMFIVILMTFVLMLSIPGTGFFMMRSAQQALLDEKQSKLFGLAALMDAGLENSFDHLLMEGRMRSAPRNDQIEFLNQMLKGATDRIALSEPGIGVGYYSRRLDAIITYGPSSDLGRKVGQSISRTHLGREVMRTGQKMVQTASLVRGEIMNCMYPIQRDNEVIGYIWANELVEDINLQMEKMTHKFYFLILLGVLVSVAGTALIAQYVAARVNRIKNGLKEIQGNLESRIPPIPGEFGEIGEAINEMAGALSERKTLEEQMQRADRLAALGEVAAGVAHEVRNPITAVKGFIQLIEEDLPPNDTKREYTGIVISEVERLDKIVEQLLYYARPSDSGKRLADINQIIKGVLPLVNFRLEKRNFKLETRFKPSLPKTLMDEEQIKQVLLNIIINSTQAMAGGDRLRISTELGTRGSLEEHLIIRIEDSGKGIEEKNLDKLFNPFFTTRPDGTGLGLAVSHRIMELHKGEIKVWSEPGKGTAFTLFLPVLS